MEYEIADVRLGDLPAPFTPSDPFEANTGERVRSISGLTAFVKAPIRGLANRTANLTTVKFYEMIWS
jgi:hypothetical protein